MSSKILPQGLLVITRNPIQYHPKHVAFSTPFSLRFASGSRVSCNVFASNLVPIVGKSAMRSFVVRAEEDDAAAGGGEVAVSVVDEGVVEGVEVEGEEEVTVKTPRKPRIALGDIMGILNKRAIEVSEKERPIPDLRTGDIVEIKLEVLENRRRASIYKGIVISKQNAGIHTTIRIRRIIAGIGVEIVFPVYSPNIKEIKVIKHRKVRRARLYYLRDKLPRLSTFK